MSGVVLVLIGLVLGFVGVRSLKLTMALVGFAAGWFLAAVFDSPATTAVLIGLAGAVVLFLLALFAVRVIFFVLGAVTGVVVGAKLFFVVDQGDSSLVLAFVFIPAVALAGAFLAERVRQPFMRWATAAAGAALTLSGLGLIAPSSLGFLRDPDKPATQTTSFLLWVALAIAMVLVQKRRKNADD